MNSIKAFFKEKGRYLFCLALVFAATVAGVLALGTLVRGMQNKGAAQQTAPQEDTPWIEPETVVNNPAQNVPKPDAASAPTDSAAGSAAESSSGAASQSGTASTGAGGSVGSQGQQAALPSSPWAAEPTQPFSGDELVYQSTLGDWRTHNGADYAVTAGADIPPAKPGTVTAVYQDALWGGVVEVAGQEGTLWRYCGLTEIAVKQDDKVTAATTLGKAGATPAEAEEGPHLHLECRRDEQYLDPESKK